MKNAITFIVGLIFSFGLGLGGTTNIPVVKGFLDVFGQWNYALVGVMGGAVLVHSAAYLIIKNRKSPILATHFHLPTKNDVDGRLLIGAAIFGIAWGWTGVCPGPGIVSITNGDPGVYVFISFMLLGMMVFKLLDKRISKK